MDTIIYIFCSFAIIDRIGVFERCIERSHVSLHKRIEPPFYSKRAEMNTHFTMEQLGVH